MEKDRVEKNREWTFDQPTEEGYYWIEIGIDDFEIVKIKKSLFEDKKSLSKDKLVAINFGDLGSPVDLSYMKGLQWCGPISPPPLGLSKEKNNEKSNS